VPIRTASPLLARLNRLLDDPRAPARCNLFVRFLDDLNLHGHLSFVSAEFNDVQVWTARLLARFDRLLDDPHAHPLGATFLSAFFTI
jgi:hypothetical protein